MPRAGPLRPQISLLRLREQPAILRAVQPWVRARGADFDPARERAALQALVGQLLENTQ